MLVTAITAMIFQANQHGQSRYDGGHLKGLFANGACILGDGVRTNGGYLIGSADGSDAQGRSVISVGGEGGRMKSDNARAVIPPRYSMRFQQKGANRIDFAVSVGPVDQEFATISMPFDFGLKSMDRFRFNGETYKLFCAENDGIYSGSGNAYAFIKPKCEIRDLSNNPIGMVAGASTEAATTWAEADGPYATVRFDIGSSQHYQKLVFMNHPGTHNVEFSFGRMHKGESASLTGTITIAPKSGPASWEFDAAKELNHQVGRAEADGWSVKVGDTKEQYMCFGPYTAEIGAGRRMAAFSLMLDNVTLIDPPALSIDVVDADTEVVLARRDLYRTDFAKAMEYQSFVLSFVSPPMARLEFRTLWHGFSYARQRAVTVQRF